MPRERIDPTNVLQNANRRALVDFVEAHPGSTFRQVCRAAGLATGTARHHISMLVRHGILREERYQATLRYFRRGAGYSRHWEAHVLLQAPQLRRLHAWLMAHPEAMQKQILDAMDREHAWSRSTTQHRLARLVEGGLVHEVAVGRRRIYTAQAPGQRRADPVHIFQRLQAAYA